MTRRSGAPHPFLRGDLTSLAWVIVVHNFSLQNVDRPTRTAQSSYCVSALHVGRTLELGAKLCPYAVYDLYNLSAS
jgi:hypothetical protein